MKRVSILTEIDKEALTRLYSDGPTHRQRQRAKAILLSAKGYTLEQIADVLDTSRTAVSGWLDRWQKRGLDGLADAPKPGRRRKIRVLLGGRCARSRPARSAATPDARPEGCGAGAPQKKDKQVG